MICFGGMFGIGKTTYAQILDEYYKRTVKATVPFLSVNDFSIVTSSSGLVRRGWDITWVLEDAATSELLKQELNSRSDK
jgi:hypothetical protein